MPGVKQDHLPVETFVSIIVKSPSARTNFRVLSPCIGVHQRPIMFRPVFNDPNFFQLSSSYNQQLTATTPQHQPIPYGKL